MIRVVLPEEAVGRSNPTLLAWLSETEDSWLRFFLDTFVHYDDPCREVMHNYFDAIFAGVDWEWRNRAPAPMADIINSILSDYIVFRQRLYPYLGFVHSTPANTYPDLEKIEPRGDGWILTIGLRERYPYGTPISH